MSLSPSQRQRFSRQILLKEIGAQGQTMLSEARVLVVGAGGLGNPILTYLASAGIGHITIIDPDQVSLSNLARQFIFNEGDIGTNKAQAIAQHLQEKFGDSHFEPIAAPLTPDNGKALFEAHDLVIEGVDRFAPRFVINQLSIATQTPFVSSAVGRFEGQVAAFAPWAANTAPCYQCLVPQIPDDEAACDVLGILGASCGVVGAQAALEAIKILTNTEPLLFAHLLILDMLSGEMRRVSLSRDPGCPAH